MLKKLSILFAFIAASMLLPLSAEVITVEEAEQTAGTFLMLDNEWHGDTDAEVRLVEHNGTPAYYIIEYNAGGWVVVAAQTTSSPIIGYNTKGEYAASHTMQLLLDFNAKVIAARAVDNEATEHKGWRRIKERKSVREINNTPDVAPLIQINLNQSAPFNNYCPEIDGQKSLVGCVAVGMAQAMMVQRYPKAPVGEYSYHDAKIGTIGVNYDKEQPYDWDGMYNGNEDEIARLVYHCGVSVQMDYGVNASGTQTDYVSSALPRHFGYDAAAVRYVTKTHDVDAWLEIVLGELSEGRAVVYRGQSGSGGHCWNIDGWKQSTQMVHCNWGWGGIGNGYFDIINMTDSYQGMEYLYAHAAVIGVGAPGTSPYDILLSKSHFAEGTNAGTVLADVNILCGDKNATYSYELYSEKRDGINTPSPYAIVGDQLVSTQTIGRDKAFKHLYIKVTNTNSGEWYEKEFKIHITTNNADDIESTYTAIAKSSADNSDYEPWQVNITADADDRNKVWLHPLCYFKNLEEQHINPVYATYNAEKGELTMPLGQVLFKRSGYNVVNVVSYDGVNIVASDSVVLNVSIDEKTKKITPDSNCMLGVADANNNYEWYQLLKDVCFTQEILPTVDVELSTTQFNVDTEVGAPLAEVIITNSNPETVFDFSLFGPKDENFNNTPSPYAIVDGQLVSTEPVVDSNRFRYVLVRAVDTATGEWYDKEFYIDIISLKPHMIVGQYNAYAKSAFTDYPDEEWQITITADTNDSNKLWIQPICLFDDFTKDDVNPVYATFDAINNVISMPLGQTLYEKEGQCRFIIGSSSNGLTTNTEGALSMRIHKKDDIIEMVLDNNTYVGVGNAIGDEWWYQLLLDVVYTNREIIDIDDIYYNITGDAIKTAEVTYRGISCDQYTNEYQGNVVIPANITYKADTYAVTGIGVQSFYKCNKLKTISLPHSIAEIGEESFSGCTALREIEVLATVPPAVCKSTFEDVDKTILVKVPAGCVEIYRNAPYWSEFTNISEISGVNDIVTDERIGVSAVNGSVTITNADNHTVVNIYNLCGTLLYRTTAGNVSQIDLPRGIYLVQVEETVHKVVI